MYMLVFVMLVIGVIGSFAQIYTKQVAQVLAQQSGAVDALLEWHVNAASLASFFVKSSSINNPGCLLTANGSWVGAPTLPPCVGSNGASTVVSFTNLTGAPDCVGGVGAPCYTVLPKGHGSAYNFYTILFQYNLRDYELTFVPPPVTGSDSYNQGFLCLPGYVSVTPASCSTPHKQGGLTFAGFMQQMRRNARLSAFSYGRVIYDSSSGETRLVTPSYLSASTSTISSMYYVLPSPGYVPVNSVGIITEITPCSSC